MKSCHILSLNFYSPEVFELCENIAFMNAKILNFHEAQRFLKGRTRTSNTSIHPRAEGKQGISALNTFLRQLSVSENRVLKDEFQS